MSALARLGHLALPAYQVGTPLTQDTGTLSSGFDFTYTTGTLMAKPGGWSGRSVKAADAQTLPILYTQGVLSALWDAGYAGAGAHAQYNLLLADTTPAWGSASSLVRRPRVVTFPALSNFSSQRTLAQTAATGWVTANASWLTANGIAVVLISESVSNLYALECGLPLTGVQIVNEGASLGNYAVGVVDPSTFVAGEVFEFRNWFQDYTDNGSTGVGFHNNQANADVATMHAIYPCYAKRQVITFGSFSGSTSNAAMLAYDQGLLNRLGDCGFLPTLTNVFPGALSDVRGFYDAQVPTVKAFFGV